jgi:hypothetical protein
MFFDRMGVCSEGRASVTKRCSGIKSDASPAKWSGRTGVPGPCVSLFNSEQVFEHRQMSPASSEGIVPSVITIRKSGGERSDPLTR